MNKKIISFLLALIVSFFLTIKFSLESLISILILILSFVVIDYSIKKINKKYNKLTIILPIILSIIYVICDSIESSYVINIFNKFLLLNLSGYFIIFYLFLINIFSITDKYIKREKEDKKIFIGNKEILSTNKFSFIFNFLLIFIINLIFLLKFYPGNLTYDSFNELMQAKGVISISNNHSLLHAGILMLFIKIGMIFKSVNLGVFLYSLFQIIVVSLTFSYILYFLTKQNVPLIFRIISLMFFSIHPINIFYSFTLWKDILFSLSFVIFTIMLYYLSNDENYFNNKKNIILFIIISLLTMCFRNNGPFIVILSFIIIYILLRKKIKKLLPIFLSIIAVFYLSKIILFNVLNIKGLDSKEILTLPSQSIARIYKNNYDSLSKNEVKQIEKFYSDKIGEVYIPIISDNTKNLLNQKYFLKHKKEYIKLNLNLFKKHKKEYLESFISNSYGYYYMNTNYSSIILQTDNYEGVIHKPIIGNLTMMLLLVLLITIIMLIVLWNLNNKENILLPLLLLPILFVVSKNISLIYVFLNIGIYVTIAFLTYVYNRKNKKNIIYYIPSIILWVMILFSPVYSEFRYLYGLFLLIPVFVGLTVKKDA